mmetsp:Transcript_49381/g.112068  ORF Transcript_49381/g.112068 Transcript_49381/m.112068 type:complete len:377 (+) Transcript_49381:720-1850(+)
MVAMCLLAFFLAASSILHLALGHGLMFNPPTRPWVAHQTGGDYCAHCMNQGGTCGASQTGQTDYNQPMAQYPTQAVFAPGDTVPVEVLITAHHRGHFEFRLCDAEDVAGGVEAATTQACLDLHPLVTLPDPDYQEVFDPNHPDRVYLPPSCALEQYSTSTGVSGRLVQASVVLPPEVQCEHCVLQWHYVTANSCNPEGYRDATFPEDDCGGWWQESLSDCSDYISPEEFWNCADVMIIADDNDVDDDDDDDGNDDDIITDDVDDDEDKNSDDVITDDDDGDDDNDDDTTTSDSDDQQCVSEAWGQCGGSTFEGISSCCTEEMYCKQVNKKYSHCVPKDLCAAADGGQCGGKGYGGSERCCGEATCVKVSNFYSHCQ